MSSSIARKKSDQVARDARRKRTRRQLQFERYEQRALMAVVNWTNPAGGAWNAPENWDTGAVPSLQDDVVLPQLQAGYSVVLSENASINSLMVATGNTFDMSQVGKKLDTAAGLTIDGTLKLGNAASSIVSTLDFSRASQTLGGKGTVDIGSAVFLNNSAHQTTFGSSLILVGDNAEFRGIASAGFVIFSSVTVRGAWDYTSSLGTLTTHGTIDVRPGGSFITRQQAGWVNHGAISVSAAGLVTANNMVNQGVISINNGQLNFAGAISQQAAGFYTRTGGTIAVTGHLTGNLTLSAVTGPWVISGGRYSDGTYVSAGSYILSVRNLATINAVDIRPGSILDVSSDSATLNIDGDVNVDGKIVVGDDSGNTSSTVGVTGTHTISGSGRIEFGASASNNFIGHSGVVTIGGGMTVSGYSAVFSAVNGADIRLLGHVQVLPGAGWRFASSIFRLETNDVIVEPNAGLTIESQTWTPVGPVTVRDDATLDAARTALTSLIAHTWTGGLYRVYNGGTLIIPDSVHSLESSLELSGSSSSVLTRLPSGILTNALSTLNRIGESSVLTLTSGAALHLTGGGLQNSGQVRVDLGSHLGGPSLPPRSVSFYRGEGNALDSVGSNHGTPVNGVTYAPGLVGDAFQFNGVDQYVTVPDSPSLRPASLTASLWYSFSSVPTTAKFLAKSFGTGAENSFALWYENSRLNAGITLFGSRQETLSFDMPADVGTRHQVAMVFEDAFGVMALFVDGQLRASRMVSGHLVYDSNPLTLGADLVNGVPNHFVPGSLDEILIYNRALESDQVRSIYDNQRGLSSAFLQTAGTMVVDGSTRYGLPAQFNGGSLGGDGVMESDVILNSARLAPGGLPQSGEDLFGSLEFQSALSLMGSSSLSIDIGGIEAGLDYDQLIVNGSVTLAGQLNINFPSAYRPQVGQRFTIIEPQGAATVSGTFNGLPEGSELVFDNVTFQLTYGNVDFPGVSLIVNSVLLVDFGDAPAGYLQASEKPSLLRLGSKLDSESVPHASANADGDDVNGEDDEDGVSIGDNFVINVLAGSASFTLSVSNGGAYVEGWIDFDGDQVWDTSETISHRLIQDGDPLTFTERFLIPQGSTPKTTFARFRVSNGTFYGPSGLGAYGEVEDYKVTIVSEYDFGDAPSDYPQASEKPSALRFGTKLDSESTPQVSTNADGDDLNGIDDEDGISIGDNFVINAAVGFAPMTINVSNGGAYVEGWIDFNGDQVWDATEKIFHRLVQDGDPLTYTEPFIIPERTTPKTTFARFRVSNGTFYGPVGAGSFGEVEDYKVTIINEYDFGDLPATYSPAWAIPFGLRFGTKLDSETSAQTSDNADGDDLNGSDDEDGIELGTDFVVNMGIGVGTAKITVSNGGAYVDGWIDFNGNGLWDGGEQVVRKTVAPGDPTTFEETFLIPSGTTPKTTFARFRVSNETHYGPAGAGGFGEIEDYKVTLVNPLDFGDLPATYGTAWAKVGSPYFGSTIDAEPSNLASDNADGDDLSGVDDEDGIELGTNFVINMAIGVGTAKVTVSNGGAYVDGWIDFDGNGLWDGGEQVVRKTVAPGDPTTFEETFLIPSGTTPKTTFARFRVSNETHYGPAGAGGFGEIEDYKVTLVNPLDFGDLPANYGTAWAKVGSPYFGSTIDAEPSALTSANADGDDLDGIDDEDGVEVGTNFVVNIASDFRTAKITVSNGGAYVDGWIDFNGNGLWDSGEQVVRKTVAPGDPTTFEETFAIPLGTTPKTTFARFRVSNETHYGPAGPGGFGEIEDYKVALVTDADFGDVPQRYVSAWHLPNGSMLGTTRDTESGPQYSSDATGDGADEDGITAPIVTNVGKQNQSISITTTGTGFLDAWIDFDGDGSWGGIDEHVFSSVELFNSVDFPTTSHALTFDVPSYAKVGTTFARFRLSTHGDLGSGGLALDGEVEDYTVQILPAISATGTGAFTTGGTFAGNYSGISTVYAADIDGDGDIDSLTAAFNTGQIAWQANDGQGGFSADNLIANVSSPTSAVAVDLDGDGDLDVLVSSFYFNAVLWYKNNGDGSFLPGTTLDNQVEQATRVFAADIDADGDMDVLASRAGFGSSGGQIRLYLNDGQASPTFSSPIVIRTGLNAAYDVSAADVNGDGRLDILSVSLENNVLSWYENSGDSTLTSSSFAIHDISNTQQALHRVLGVDLDRDGDTDILASSILDNRITWYRNDGNQFTTVIDIDTNASGVRSIEVADLDGDNDFDVLASLLRPSSFVWYRNDGSQAFSRTTLEELPGETGAHTSVPADIDGDGDLDVLAGTYYTGIVKWYRQTRQLSTVTLSLDGPSEIAENSAGSLAYRFVRTGSTAQPLTVQFSIGGSAQYGVDFTVAGITGPDANSGLFSVVIPAGSSFVNVGLAPINDSKYEFNENAAFTLSGSSDYNIGSPESASAIILNDDPKPTVDISLLAPTALYEDSGSLFTFQLTRSGPTDDWLNVQFTLDGTASPFGFPPDYEPENGGRFEFFNSVFFEPGQSTTTVKIRPVIDNELEPDETIVVSLRAFEFDLYAIGTQGSATATILSRDFYWTGSGDGSNWNDPNNWSKNVVPSATDAVKIPGYFNAPAVQVAGPVAQVAAIQTDRRLIIGAGGVLEVGGDMKTYVSRTFSLVVAGTLRLTDDALIDSAAISFETGGAHRIQVLGGVEATLAATSSITASGALPGVMDGAGALINLGTISATLSSSNALHIDTASFRNVGTLGSSQQSGSGAPTSAPLIEVSSSLFRNDGYIQIGADPMVASSTPQLRIESSQFINTGHLVTNSQGFVDIQAATWRNYDAVGGQTWYGWINNEGTMTFGGTLDNSGTLLVGPGTARLSGSIHGGSVGRNLINLRDPVTGQALATPPIHRNPLGFGTLSKGGRLTVLGSAATIDNVNVGSVQLIIGSSAALSVQGTNTFDFGRSGTDGDATNLDLSGRLLVSEDAVLEGALVTFMGSNSETTNRIEIASGKTLTLGSTSTLRAGSEGVVAGSGTLRNLGTINPNIGTGGVSSLTIAVANLVNDFTQNADGLIVSAGRIATTQPPVIFPAARIEIHSPRFVNNGVIDIAGSASGISTTGGLLIDSSQFINTGHLITQVEGTADIQSATWRNYDVVGGQTWYGWINNQGTMTFGGSLDNTGTTLLVGPGTARLSGSIHGGSVARNLINLRDPVTGQALATPPIHQNPLGFGTLSKGGRLTVLGSAATIDSVNVGSVQLVIGSSAALIVQGNNTFDFGRSGTDGNPNNLDLSGRLLVSEDAVLDGALVTFMGSNSETTNRIEIASGKTLTLGSTSTLRAGGEGVVAGGGTLRNLGTINPNIGLSGGPSNLTISIANLVNDVSQTVDGLIVSVGKIGTSQTFINLPVAMIEIQSSHFVNNGAVDIQGGVTTRGNGLKVAPNSLVNRGTIGVSLSGSLLLQSQSIDNYGTINTGGFADDPVDAYRVDVGSFINRTGARLTTVGRIFASGGFTNEGVVATPAGVEVPVNFQGLVTGSGSFDGYRFIFSGGTDFGTGPVTTEFNTSVALLSNSVFQIGGTQPGTGYDQIHATRNIDLSGTLSVSLVNGFVPKVGDRFRLLSSDQQLTVIYLNDSLPAILGRTWEWQVSGNALDLVFKAAPTVTLDLPVGAAANNLVLRRRDSDDYLELLDLDSQSILVNLPAVGTQRITINGNNVDAERLLVDFDYGGFFSTTIVFQGGTGVGDALSVKGGLATEFDLITQAGTLANGRIDANEFGEVASIVYGGIEPIALLNAVTVDLPSSLNVGNQSLTIESITVTTLGQSLLLAGGSITAPGGLYLGEGRTVVGAGTITAPFSTHIGSTITATGNLTLAANSLVNRGTIGVSPSGSLLLQSQLIDNYGTINTGGFADDAADSYRVDVGSFINRTGARLTTIGRVLSSTGFINDGVVAAPVGLALPVNFQGLVTGLGSFEGSQFIFSGGTNFGAGPVTTEFNSSIALLSNSVFQIGGTQPGTGYDQIHATRNIDLNGTLSVSLANGFVPSVGDRFRLLSSDQALVVVNLNDSLPVIPGRGWEWQVSGKALDLVFILAPTVTLELPSGAAANDLVLRRRDSDDYLELVDLDNQSILVDLPAAGIQRITINGNNIDAERLLVDFDYGGFFSTTIVFQGGSGTGDALRVKGGLATEFDLITQAGTLANGRIDANEFGEVASIVYGGIEPIALLNAVTVDLPITLSIGNQALTIEATTFTTLGQSLLLAGGSITAPGGLFLGAGRTVVGSGTITAPISTQAGSTITATGNLTLGDSTALDGVEILGRLNVRNFTVTLLDAHQAILGSQTTIGTSTADGRLTASGGILVGATQTISGRGTISTPGNRFVNQGFVQATSTGLTFTDLVTGAGSYAGNVTFSGGTSFGNSPTITNIAGNAVFAPTNTATVEIGGTTAGTTYDKVVVTGNLTLGGNLVVQLIDLGFGFVPKAGDSFVLFSAAAITGSFANVTLPTAPTGTAWKLNTTSTQVTLALVPANAPTVVAAEINGNSERQRSMVQSVKLTFSSRVDLLPGAIEVRLVQGVSISQGTPINYDIIIPLRPSEVSVVNGRTVVVVRFADASGNELYTLGDGKYKLKIFSDKVIDVLNGQKLDGDFNNVAGGDYSYRAIDQVTATAVDYFYRLYGDYDGDRDTDGRDLLMFSRASGSTVGQVNYLWYFDVDGDGAINASDLAEFNVRRNKHTVRL